MTLELDEETLAELGWGTAEDREERLRVNHSVFKVPVSRIATGDIDGRSKARDRVALSQAYWARRKAS